MAPAQGDENLTHAFIENFESFMGNSGLGQVARRL